MIPFVWTGVFLHSQCLNVVLLPLFKSNHSFHAQRHIPCFGKNSSHATITYNLRIPDSYDAKIVKICNPWTFWPFNSANKPSIQNPTKNPFAQCSIDVTTLFTSMEHWPKRIFVRF